MTDAEKKPLLKEIHRTYFRRWFVLLYTCGVYLSTSLGWNMWGPIAQTTEHVYEWDDSTIATTFNVGRAGMIVFLIPICYMLDNKGLRVSFIVCIGLGFLGNVLRCLMQLSTQSATWLAMLSQICMGVASTCSYNAPSMLAAVWFPTHERTSATAIGVMVVFLGYGLSYVLKPQIVSAPVLIPVTENGVILNTSYTNTSEYINGTWKSSEDGNSSDISYIVFNTEIMKSEINLLFYIETSFAAVLLVLGLALLPRAPPTPPSSSAAVTRIDYRSVFVGLVKNGFLSLLLLYTGILVGIYSSWIAIIDIAVEHLGTSQDEAGWLGFYILLISGAVGFIFARFSDMCGRKTKLILLMMLTVSSLSFLWLSLLCGKHIPSNSGQLYASSIIACAFMNGCIPLLYEQICEAAFPIPEGIILGLTALVTNFAGIIYLLPLSLMSEKDNSWLEWALLGTGLAGIVVILVTPQRYGRADMDLAVTVRTDVKYEHLSSDTTKVDAERDIRITQSA